MHCIPIMSHSLWLVNSLKIQWNHLAHRDTFCCSNLMWLCYEYVMPSSYELDGFQVYLHPWIILCVPLITIVTKFVTPVEVYMVQYNTRYNVIYGLKSYLRYIKNIINDLPTQIFLGNNPKTNWVKVWLVKWSTI
jgi:hypothetical protein